MRTFFISCLAAIVIAAGGALILNNIQKSADVAYSTSAVRI